MIMALESSNITISADLIKTKLLQEVKNSDTSLFFINKSEYHEAVPAINMVI